MTCFLEERHGVAGTRDLHQERTPAGPAGPATDVAGAGGIVIQGGGSGQSKRCLRSPPNPALSGTLVRAHRGTPH
jgi:hypothetical protein